MSNNQPPQIEEIKLSELVIDITHSGRTEAEIKANAKELAPVMAATGHWDASQPGQYFERDGKKHLLAAFTRVASAQINGWKTGWFVKVPDDQSANQFAAIRTNSGKPISAREKGRIFARAKAGGDAESTPVGGEIAKPLTVNEIAEQAGCSRTWVEDCIGIFESYPSVGDLIEGGDVSVGVVRQVQKAEKSETKQLAILMAAIKEAQANGKSKATQVHFDAIKEKYIQPKLKAVSSQTPPKAATPPPATSTPEAEENDASEQPEAVSVASEPKPSSQNEESEPDVEQQPELMAEQPQTAQPAIRVDDAKLRGRLTLAISNWRDKIEDSISDEEFDMLLDTVMQTVATQVPF